MFKFQKEIDESINRLAESKHIPPDQLMYVAFEWDTGFVVMEQSVFIKLKKADKNRLLAPMMKNKKVKRGA